MNIFVLDPHPLMCEIIGMLVHRIHTHVNVVAAQTFKQLNSLINKYEDVEAVIIEPKSTGCVGYLSVSYIAQILPGSKIIVITDTDFCESGNQYLKSGAHYVLSKKDKVGKIAASLQDILNPKLHDEELPLSQVGILKISKRHRQLIGLLARGYTNQEIADFLNLKEQTIKVHFFRLFKIIGVKNRLQALNFAKSNGWLVDTSDS